MSMCGLNKSNCTLSGNGKEEGEEEEEEEGKVGIQLRCWKPMGPPCRWLGPLFTGREYFSPDGSEKEPSAIRLAKRPQITPSEDRCFAYSSQVSNPSTTSMKVPEPSLNSNFCNAAPLGMNTHRIRSLGDRISTLSSSFILFDIAKHGICLFFGGE